MLGLFYIPSSCNKEPCEEVTCQNGGACNDGSCACPVGFTGSECQDETRATYFGLYSGLFIENGVIDSTEFNLTTYPGNILRITWEDDDFIELTTNTSFNIPDQSFGSDVIGGMVNPFHISGSGFIRTETNGRIYFEAEGEIFENGSKNSDFVLKMWKN